MATATALANAVENVAENLGENVSKIRVANVDWSRLMEDGVLVHVTFRRWRAETQMKLSDLGISPNIRPNADETPSQFSARLKEAEQALERIVTPGKLHLLPKSLEKQAKKIEDRAREVRDAASLRTHWGYWIHINKYLGWKEEHATQTAKYEALAAQIDQDWDQLMRQIRNDYAGLALQSYQRLITSAAWRAGLVELPSQSEFVAAFVERIMLKIPRREQVVASYQHSYEVTFVPLQQTVAKNEAEAGQIRLDAARQAMLADVRATEARKAAEGVQRFVADVQSQVRQQVYDVVVGALDAIKKGGKLPNNTTRGLRNLVEEMSTTIFWEDPELEARLAKLGSVISIPSVKRSDEDLRNALVALGSEARLVLVELDREPARSARDLGIPDDLEGLESIARSSRDISSFDPDLFELGEEEDRQPRTLDI